MFDDEENKICMTIFSTEQRSDQEIINTDPAKEFGSERIQIRNIVFTTVTSHNTKKLNVFLLLAVKWLLDTLQNIAELKGINNKKY